MTEAEWLACADAEPMLAFLRGKVSERKARLFVCACCRSAWDGFRDERSRLAVAVAERLADGVTTPTEVSAARAGARAAARSGAENAEAARAAQAAISIRYGVHDTSPAGTAEAAAHNVMYLLVLPAVQTEPEDLYWTSWCNAVTIARRSLAALVHDIFGNPFRPASVDPSWLAWNGSVVRKLAQVIYDDRGFDDMPVLADALEEAGCDSADILSHCRGAGPHVRGCWVLDLLLGKE